MRHQYTPVFRSILASRLWAMSDAARIIWLWMNLMADPEGFVACDLKGVSLGARVDPLLARGALCELAEPDPDLDPAESLRPGQGALMARVAGGYRVLGLEFDRELAKLESRRAHNRRYMARVRANEKVERAAPPEPTLSPLPDTLPPHLANVDTPIPRPKPIPRSEISEAEISSAPPAVEVVAVAWEELSDEPLPESVRAGLRPVPMEPRVQEALAQAMPVPLHVMPAGWQPSPELRADAAIAGVTNLDERLASLQTGPIGGMRGVLPSQLDNYVRAQFPKWRVWQETDKLRAVEGAKSRHSGVTAFADGPRQTGWGMHLAVPHVDFAAKHGLDANKLASEFIRSGAIDKLRTHEEADKAFAAHLKALVRAKKGAA